MVEGCHHSAAGQQGGGLLRCTALGNRQGIRAALVEAERVHAIDHDLAGEFGRQAGQQLAVVLVGDSDNLRRGESISVAAMLRVGNRTGPF